MAEQTGGSMRRNAPQPARRSQRISTREQARQRVAQKGGSGQQVERQAAPAKQQATRQAAPAKQQTTRTEAAPRQRATASRTKSQAASARQQSVSRQTRPVASTATRSRKRSPIIGILDSLPSWLVPGILGVLALFLVIGLVMLVGGCVRACSSSGDSDQQAVEEPTPFVRSMQLIPAVAATEESPAKPAYRLYDEGRTTATGEGRVSFSAVGDNLINSNLLELVASWSPVDADGVQTYDFHPMYEHIKPYIQDGYDISFINQETIMGGTSYFDYTGYPSYNTPESMAEAIYDTGWRVMNSNSNHIYDIWVDAIKHQQQMFAEHYPEIAVIGSYSDEADYQTPRVVECNGVRVAFLSYSYGQNGYELSDLPNYYYSTWWDEDRMKADVARAREVADAVVVYLHTGIEYTNTPSPDQVTWSYACAQANVDMVIGSHVHWIQPIEWLDRADGGKMLVVHGLGDFVSGYHDNPECIVGGMFSCDIVKVEPTAPAEQEQDTADGEAGATADEDSADDQYYPTGIKLENLVWHPTIEHWADGSDAVYLMRDYTPELASANELLSGLSDPYQWIIDTTEAVIGDVVDIDWGEASQDSSAASAESGAADSTG